MDGYLPPPNNLGKKIEEPADTNCSVFLYIREQGVGFTEQPVVRQELFPE